MRIKEMFVKPVWRDMKGVIKVGQDDDANIRQELEEYVVTRELQKYFREFFDSYKNGIHGNTDKMGVWISGFFGSGKSHFLKILSYLLENKTVDGKPAIEYFAEGDKIKDPMVLADMRLAASIPTDVVLFNIDAKSQMNGSENREPILSVFLKVFNEMQGFYGAIPVIADVERNLTENGRFEEFEEAFEEEFGSPWKEARSDFDFIQDTFVDVLVDMDYLSEAAARNICEKATRPYNITIEEFAELVRKYLERKGNNHHVAFLVDEIGQYIGDNSSLMLNLQTVVENLGTACKGKAWVIVTSQQDIDSITKTKSNDFSKIQGRFDTRLSLSSGNVDEVIRERLLKKNETAAETLSLYYDSKETIIKNLILFNDGAEKKLYADNKSFSEVYPFIPYQFNLLGSVLTAIRTHGASGKHLAEGERSMLALFKESAVKIMEMETGKIVPFHMFYDALEQFLDHSHKSVISRALDNGILNPEKEDDCFDVNVLKTLFLVKYVKEIECTLDNITSLMISHFDDDRMELTAKVEAALKHLEQQTLIQKNGNIYIFLTNEEQEITIAIKNQPVDSSEVTAKVSELIFDGLFDEKKYRYPLHGGRYAFPFSQIVDDKPYKANQNHDLSLKILTPNSDERADDQTMRMVSAQNGCVLVVLPEDRAFLDELYSSIQIEKFIVNDAINTVTKYEQIKEAKRVELRERRSAAKLFLEDALKSADIYVKGDRAQIGSKEVSARMQEAIGKLASSVYHKLSYIDTPMGELDIKKLFNDTHQQLTIDGTNKTPNSLALDDVRAYISLNSSHHAKTSMKTLLDRFTKAPYGFIEADVQWLVAKLFKDGDITLYISSEPVTLLSKSVDEIVKFITRKEFNDRLMTEERERVKDKDKKYLRDVTKELFHISLPNEDEDAMVANFMNFADKMISDLEKLEIHYKNQPAYPGKDVISDGKKLLLNLQQIKNTNEFFTTVSKNADAYFDFAEYYEPVKKFFNAEQVGIFDRALRLMGTYDDSQGFIVNAKIESIVEQVKAILKKKVPYNDIHKLPELLNNFVTSYAELMKEMEGPILVAIDEAKARVFEKLDGKRCYAFFHDSYLKKFADLRNKAETCDNVAKLHTITLEADNLKIRCLKEIDDKENLLAKEEAENNGQGGTPAGGGVDASGTGETPDTIPVPAPKIKKHKTISIKSVASGSSWQIETADDVKKYIAELEAKLLSRIEEDTVINVEF